MYAIFDRTTGATLYVGRTKNIRRRLYTNHLMGPKTNARLKNYLTEDPNRPDIPNMEAAKSYLIDNCFFKYKMPMDKVKNSHLVSIRILKKDYESFNP